MFTFFHGYSPDTWDAMVKNGLVGKNDGIRFCQNQRKDFFMKFNALARKDGELYNIIKERNCPLYIDRLQGGTAIDAYNYDPLLLEEYKTMLGDKFYGMQMHEWLSNYNTDVNRKLKGLPAEQWTEENISKMIFEKYKVPYLHLESMKLEEMAAYGKPESLEQFYKNMTAVFKKRQRISELIPCDSYFLAYQFELSVGVKRLMPEIGAQVPDTRVQICYARGMTREKGKTFGTYYEPWGGEPFTCCSYNDKNEWGYTDNAMAIFKRGGANGGSSRSLQRRMYLYSYLSNAEFISEEWGLYNTFAELDDFSLSPYGKVKKEFLNFVQKFDDVGEKLTPLAAVISDEIPVLTDIYDDDKFCGYTVESHDKLTAAKTGIRKLFCQSEEMIGTEKNFLKNSRVPDCIDLINRKEALLGKYDYLIDLTGESELRSKYGNICEIEDVAEVIKQLLPCYVDGGLHWMVNECTNGGYYLTVFNHSGVVRTVADGEKILPEADQTVIVSFKDNRIPRICAGAGTIELCNGRYHLTVPAGDYAFIWF